MTTPEKREAPSVVVCHPGVQQSYETVVGLQQAGMLNRFITSVYHRDQFEHRRAPWRWLPARQRQAAVAGVRRRWHPAIDARRVQTIATPFLAMRGAAGVLDAVGLRRFHGVEQLGDAGFDALVARALPRRGVTQVHAFEGAALHTLREARRRGLGTVLDVPSAHEYNLAVAAAEADASGRRLPPRFGSSGRVRAERRVADVVVSPSNYVSKCLLLNGVDAGKLVKIPFGADPDVFSPADNTEHDRRFVLLDVGSINHRKGTRYLLQAWRELALPDAELVLAGEPDEAGRDLLREYDGQYRNLGHVPWPDLPGLFRSATAFVLPSLAEGPALVTYMAMASALPVIVT
jgi:glycosyltransferase involved in cell wall biosynthesis